MTTHNLLVELFVEELPPKALKRLGASFAGTLTEELKRQGLLADTSQTTHFASPRRLAAHITDVAAKAADKPVRAKLMPVQVALDAQGQATPALLKKLQALGADASVVPQLVRAPDGKSEALFLDRVEPGAALADGLQAALEAAIAKLPIPKVMTYQLSAGTALPGWDSVQFVRPAHGLVALHGEQVVPVTALGLTAGRATHGHRFEAAMDPIELPTADSYAAQLRLHGAVIASFEERRADIAAQLHKAAAEAGEGLRAIEDEALLDEVTALVERPNVLVCRFDEQFLGVPQECLILTMKANQKYFPLLDAQGRLTNRFLVVSNISPADASAVIGGNERVVRPRLADAKFFFDQDRKKPLESRVEGLAKVVYHNKLGTQGERVERVRAIARAIAGQIAAANPLAGGQSLVERADLAAKLAGRVVDTAIKEMDARDHALWPNAEVTRARKALEGARAAAVEALRTARYFVKQADWLQERFPDAVLRDVEGLVKRVSRAEIAAHDHSLTPGRYVGVAPEEVDEDFDFEEALRSIHIDLKGLNDEAAELAARIARNFEELGV